MNTVLYNLNEYHMPSVFPKDANSNHVSQSLDVMSDFAKYYGIPETYGKVPVKETPLNGALGVTKISPIDDRTYKVEINLDPKIFSPYVKMFGVDEMVVYHEFTHVLSVPLTKYFLDLDEKEQTTIMEMLATYGLSKYLSDKGHTEKAINVAERNPYKAAWDFGQLIDEYYGREQQSKESGLKKFVKDMQKYGARKVLDELYRIAPATRELTHSQEVSSS